MLLLASFRSLLLLLRKKNTNRCRIEFSKLHDCFLLHRRSCQSSSRHRHRKQHDFTYRKFRSNLSYRLESVGQPISFSLPSKGDRTDSVMTQIEKKVQKESLLQRDLARFYFSFLPLLHRRKKKFHFTFTSFVRFHFECLLFVSSDFFSLSVSFSDQSN